jgi:hypothetical protein
MPISTAQATTHFLGPIPSWILPAEKNPTAIMMVNIVYGKDACVLVHPSSFIRPLLITLHTYSMPRMTLTPMADHRTIHLFTLFALFKIPNLLWVIIQAHVIPACPSFLRLAQPQSLV